VRLLDRYVIRNFLQAYLYCIAGFISIWLIFDISDNISTLLDERVGLLLAVQYYITQVPQVFIILLPVSLLLALLFSLGRMSRANEIVSMLTAGVSVPRVLLPLIGWVSRSRSHAEFSFRAARRVGAQTFFPKRGHPVSDEGQIFATGATRAPGSSRIFAPADRFNSPGAPAG
jgi:hypothetical protein